MLPTSQSWNRIDSLRSQWDEIKRFLNDAALVLEDFVLCGPAATTAYFTMTSIASARGKIDENDLILAWDRLDAIARNVSGSCCPISAADVPLFWQNMALAARAMTDWSDNTKIDE